MKWHQSPKLPWLIAPLAILSILVTLSLLDGNQRQTLLVVTCCMLGVVPVTLFHAYRKDIHERDQTARALMESETRHSQFLELAPTPILLVRGGRILQGNRSWERIIGASSTNDYRNQKIEHFLDLSCRDLVGKHILEAERSKRETVIAEHSLIRLDGTKVHVEMTAMPVVEMGQPAVQLIVLDVSERRRAQDTLEKAKAQIQAADSAKTQFLANVSHEIRTPMNAIIGVSGLLLDSPVEPRMKPHLEVIRHSADHLLAMFNDVLDLAKIEAGQLEMESCPFDLEQSLTELADILLPQAHAKHLDISLIYGPSIARRFVGDPGRIRQITIHLLENAIRFTERGRILIAVEEERRTEDAALIRISVSDTGLGIPDDQLKRLFSAFQQGDDSTTRKHSGMGIGLVLCKRLVEWMNGTIGVVSKAGLGSTFHFNLPLTLNLNEAQTPQTPRRPIPEVVDVDVFKGRRILLVEDNAINQKLGAVMLERFGARVDVASNGKEAVQMADRLPYDAIFMDCQMPEMDGYEATTEIRRREIGRIRTPIFAMTAHAFRGDKEKCLASGMDDYVSKPVNVDDIRALLIAVSVYPAASPSAVTPELCE